MFAHKIELGLVCCEVPVEFLVITSLAASSSRAAIPKCNVSKSHEVTGRRFVVTLAH